MKNNESNVASCSGNVRFVQLAKEAVMHGEIQRCREEIDEAQVSHELFESVGYGVSGLMELAGGYVPERGTVAELASEYFGVIRTGLGGVANDMPPAGAMYLIQVERCFQIMVDKGELHPRRTKEIGKIVDGYFDAAEGKVTVPPFAAFHPNC